MMVLQFPVKGYPLTEEILVQYGQQDGTFWGCFGMLCLLFIGFRLLVIFSLALQDRKRGASENDTRNTNIKPRKVAGASGE